MSEKRDDDDEPTGTYVTIPAQEIRTTQGRRAFLQALREAHAQGQRRAAERDRDEQERP